MTLGVLVLAGGLLFTNFWYFKPLSIDWFYSRVFVKSALSNPEMLTSMRMLEPMGIRGHNARLSDSSPEAAEEQLACWQKQYEVFQRYDREDYEGQDLLSYDGFDFFMGNTLADADRVGSAMDAILRSEGLTEGTIGERVRQIAERPDQLYPDTAEGREQIIADYPAIIDEIDPAMDEYFNLRPTVGVEVRRVPEFSQATAPGEAFDIKAFHEQVIDDWIAVTRAEQA